MLAAVLWAQPHFGACGVKHHGESRVPASFLCSAGGVARDRLRRQIAARGCTDSRALPGRTCSGSVVVEGVWPRRWVVCDCEASSQPGACLGKSLESSRPHVRASHECCGLTSNCAGGKFGCVDHVSPLGRHACRSAGVSSRPRHPNASSLLPPIDASAGVGVIVCDCEASSPPGACISKSLENCWPQMYKCMYTHISMYITTRKETHTPTDMNIGDVIRFAAVSIGGQSLP